MSVARPGDGTAIAVDGVSKKFRIYHERNQSLKAAIMRGRRSVHEDFWAVRDVSFDVPAGSTFGLVGNNGSGKSTLLKCIAQILVPDAGTIRADGRMAALLEVGSGFHPELSGRDNVYLNGSILGMTKKEIDRKFDEIVDFSGVEQFIDQPVKNYSSGMYVRLGFSVAINVDPEILLVDEVLAVGDAAFQEKCTEKFAEFRREGRTVVIVSHSMHALQNMCDNVAWLDHGSLVETGPAKPILERYSDSTRTGVRATEAGQVRWGSGEALVEGLEVLHDGTPSTALRTGDDVTFRLHYNALERIDDPVFGLAMESTDGTYVWAHHTRDAGFFLDKIEGRGTVEYRVPKLALQPGTYVLHAAVNDSSTLHVYDYVRESARITVDFGTPRESGGYVILGGRWE